MTFQITHDAIWRCSGAMSSSKLCSSTISSISPASLNYALGVSASDLNEKQINIQLDLAAKEHHCWADAARLQQVFWNIIKNSVKFTPARGQLRISTRNDAEH